MRGWPVYNLMFNYNDRCLGVVPNRINVRNNSRFRQVAAVGGV